MAELRQKKGPKKTFSYKKQKHVKDPKAPSATRKELIEEEDEDENEDEENDEEDKESHPSLRESITKLQMGLTTLYHAWINRTICSPTNNSCYKNFTDSIHLVKTRAAVKMERFYSPYIEENNLFLYTLRQRV
ncbi:hypothetical protein M9H77_17987 [Catharanthus roseus]|uniref:Uncharacterized protein n=1 Tax=Catharanthus roseus TaxID=4058 RepID=A0ACC0B658_CATRO|nr:hypothetical protein M9H77_17987 [Catharanthus roseus]